MNDKERLESLIKHLKTNKNALARELKNSASIFRNIETGRNGISANLARKIINKYPEINYEWVLTGKGTMLVNPKEAPVDNLLLKRVELLERLAGSQDDRINYQNQRIEKLEALFDTKKNLTPQSF